MAVSDGVCLRTRDGAGEVVLGGLDRAFERKAFGEACRDGARKGAACAVGIFRVDAPPRVGDEVFAIIEKVIGIHDVMSALDEDGFAAEGHEYFGGFSAVGLARNGHAGEDFGFGDIRRDECRKGDEFFFIERDGIVFEQRVSAGGDHDGINDERRISVISKEIGHCIHDGSCPEHACLDGVRCYVVVNGFELGFDHGNRSIHDHADACRILRGQGADTAHAVGAEGGKGLQVGLNTGAAGGVGARDGE